MRTTWIILLLMVAAGGLIYLLVGRQPAATQAIATSFGRTPDSIRNRTRLFTATDPAKLYYRDSTWTTTDSMPLQQLPPDSARQLPGSSGPVTYILDYDHRFFYDIELPPATGSKPLSIHFDILPVKDTLQVEGSVYMDNISQFRFSGPMMKMYPAFLITYTNKLPPDSSATDSTEKSAFAGASKIITVL